MNDLERRLKEICDYLKNYFIADVYERTFTVVNNEIDLNNTNIQEGQFFLVEDSVFNDGLYQYPCASLQDEQFKGAVTTLRIPSDIIQIAKESIKWEEDNAKTLNSPLQSESFGGYSYTKASSQISSTGQFTWKDAFIDRLRGYKKL